MIDAVGMEAHGSPRAEGGAEPRRGCCRTRVAQPMHRQAGGRPPRRAARRHQGGTPRRHGLDLRGLRRRGRSDADDGDVRQGDPDPDGPGHVKRWIDDIMPLSSTTLTRWAPRTWRPTCCRWRRSARLRDVPEEGGRLHQGAAGAGSYDPQILPGAPGRSRRPWPDSRSNSPRSAKGAPCRLEPLPERPVPVDRGPAGHSTRRRGRGGAVSVRVAHQQKIRKRRSAATLR